MKHIIVSVCALWIGCGGPEVGDEGDLDGVLQGATAMPCGAGAEYGLECPTEPTCAFVRCGGIPFAGGQIWYEIALQGSPACPYTAADVDKILEVADQLTLGTNGVVRMTRCTNDNCSGQGVARWIRVQTRCGTGGSGGAVNSNGQQVVTVGAGSSLTQFAHEIMHAVGTPHNHNRYDRDRHVALTSSWFCADQERTDDTWKCGFQPTFGPDPDIAMGLFGPYAGDSVMTYLSADICERDGQEPDWDAGLTEFDTNSAIELYRWAGWSWSPFHSLGKDISPTLPLAGGLTGFVAPVGSPAVASQAVGLLDVFSRGTDNKIHYMFKNVSGGRFVSWSSWVDHSGGLTFQSDPAAVSWGPGRTDVLAVSTTGSLLWRYYSAPNWSSWQSLGSPSGTTIASAPAVATTGTGRLYAFVRGADNRLYQRSYVNGAWGSWIRFTNGSFNGKPAAAGRASSVIDVVVRGNDGYLWHLVTDGAGGGGFQQVPGGTLRSGSSPALVSLGANRLEAYVRGQDSRLWRTSFSSGIWSGYATLGGKLGSDPAAAGRLSSDGSIRIDVAARLSDGVIWSRWYPSPAPDMYQAPNTCL